MSTTLIKTAHSADRVLQQAGLTWNASPATLRAALIAGGFSEFGADNWIARRAKGAQS